MLTHEQLFARKNPRAPVRCPSSIGRKHAAPLGTKKKSILNYVAKHGKLPNKTAKRPTVGPTLPSRPTATHNNPPPAKEDLKAKLSSTQEELTRAQATIEVLKGKLQQHAANQTTTGPKTDTTDWRKAYTDLANRYNTLLMMATELKLPHPDQRGVGWDFPPYEPSLVRPYLRRCHKDLDTAIKRRVDEATHWDKTQLTTELPIPVRQ